METQPFPINQPPSSHRRKMVLVLVCIAVGIAIAGYFLLRSNSSESAEEVHLLSATERSKCLGSVKQFSTHGLTASASYEYCDPTDKGKACVSNDDCQAFCIGQRANPRYNSDGYLIGACGARDTYCPTDRVILNTPKTKMPSGVCWGT